MKRTIWIDPERFNAVYLPYLQDDTFRQVYFGGSSSGKSYFLATRAVLDVMSGRNYLILRNVAKTVRNSCWNEISKAIQSLGLSAYFGVSKSELTITSKVNGCQIAFAGLDDVEKIKSITPASGVLTDIWIEEATETAYEDFKQLEKRLRGLSKHNKRMTLSFNPVYKEHWIYKHFFKAWGDDQKALKDGDLSILKTTYRDNRFLTQDDIDRIESEQDEYYRNVYTLGNWGVLGDVIFRNWRVEDLTEFAKTADKLYFGLDFGFSSDPAAGVKVHYDRARKRIYVLDELQEKGLTNDHLARLLKPFAGRNYITCDSSEPKSIAELKAFGINALGAAKGPDSVIHGIQWLQGHEIIVNTKCQNMKNELTLYQWRKDKDGNSMRVPEDRNNHCLTGDTLVETETGQVPISELVGKTGMVKCYDLKQSVPTIGRFFDCRMTRDEADIYEIETEDMRIIRCTGDHLILTRRGWVEAAQLTAQDEIVDIGGAP